MEIEIQMELEAKTEGIQRKTETDRENGWTEADIRIYTDTNINEGT